MYYILEDDKIIPEPDPRKWARWMSITNTSICRDELGDLVVSTVFLGMDHNLSGEGPPLLFETMIFRPPSWGGLYCRRYATIEEARTGHAEVLQETKDGTLP